MLRRMQVVVRHFGFSFLVTVVGLTALYLFGGVSALVLAVLLTLLEITLSFDNAVVNARVLERMAPMWQQRFLTWGILIAVFGTRFILPIVIVSVVTLMSPLAVAHLALFDAHTYGELLESAKYAIHAFGATFLLMVSLKYFLDTKKQLHWITLLEQRLARWGSVEALEIVLALLALAAVAFIVPASVQGTVLMSGIFGMVTFILMHGLTSSFALSATETAKQSVPLFLYLEVLDASFSLDGVIGAFALTSSIPIIAVGLGIGAFFVRSLTIYMLHARTLDTFKYLEHGAHWAILGLAVSMLVSMLTDVPEFITGTVGIAFVLAAYVSSLRARV